jgi:hypothetical protein
MKAILEINGEVKSYPQSMSHLEELLLFALTMENQHKEIVTEVKVDGAVYSEAYPHHAQEIPLDKIRQVEIHTQTEKDFAKDFIDLIPTYLDKLEAGFKTSARLLKSPFEKSSGFQILGLSVDGLRHFKSHHDQVRLTLGEGEIGLMPKEFWQRLEQMIDPLLQLETQRDAISISIFLGDQVVPFFSEWKKRFCHES